MNALIRGGDLPEGLYAASGVLPEFCRDWQDSLASP